MDEVEVRSRAELRAWLQEHGPQSGTTWLITYKKATPEFHVSYDEIVEELICFGWIDGRVERSTNCARNFSSLPANQAADGAESTSNASKSSNLSG